MSDHNRNNYILLILVGMGLANLAASSLEGGLRVVVQIIAGGLIILAVWMLSPLIAKGGKK